MTTINEEEFQKQAAKNISKMENVKAIGQFHHGRDYVEVTVYLHEVEMFDARAIPDGGKYHIECYNPLIPAVELAIEEYPRTNL